MNARSGMPRRAEPSQTQLVVLGISGTLWLLFCNFVASLGAGSTPSNVPVIGTGFVLAALWVGALVVVVRADDRRQLVSALLMVLFLVADFLWAIFGGATLRVGRNGVGVAQTLAFVEVSVAVAATTLLPAVLRLRPQRVGAAVCIAAAALLCGGFVLVARIAAVTPRVWTLAGTGGSSSLNAVSCPSVRLCVAVDSTGDVVTSTHPSAQAKNWHDFNVDGRRAINGVSCPSESFCVAVDESGNAITSTDPAGGATAWTVVRIDGSSSLDGVSCAGTSLCVAVDNGGNVVTSTHPLGGAGAWTVTNVEGSANLNAVSCPTASLCVAVDDSGFALASTDPSGDAGSWIVTRVDGSVSLSSISCATPSLCVAVDDNGNAVTTADPSGLKPHWSVVSADSSASLVGVSCWGDGGCLAVELHRRRGQFHQPNRAGQQLGLEQPYGCAESQRRVMRDLIPLSRGRRRWHHRGVGPRLSPSHGSLTVSDRVTAPQRVGGTPVTRPECDARCPKS